MTSPRLLDDEALEQSSVVANNAMNRDRNLDGVNSYRKDLGFDPLSCLTGEGQSWLDICCGSGRALIQAARAHPHLRLTGVDLVDFFDPTGAGLPGLTLTAASIVGWRPDHAFDLITCVHGLHYVGDKLGVVARALRWLKPDGFFAAHLDLSNLKLVDGGRMPALKGLRYDSHRRLVTRRGPLEMHLGLEYVGADDTCGPNFTGQPAVDSYYRPVSAPRRRRGPA
ncbi:class I SAM-dependent methyltransferase [Allorhizocola rhizosphaerae]|uniref:class I SAM-dependent methyltransferase n=1 Tax=Allorhizocola rhizosphaerae TaxID=1872709 RepID=UPI001FEC7388|nr:class I SAM-dependent methyltransferase [Allorhizocola rhizosphaerae]